MLNKTKEKNNIIYSLQGLRIYASIIVLLIHLVYIFEDKLGIFTYRVYINFGKSAVPFFFVLSGYVMYMIHKKDLGRGLKIGRSFAWKRFVRIYPTYWVLTTIVVVAMFLLPGEVKAYKNDFWYIFQSYSLLELGLMKGLAIIPPAWSMFHEVKFYIFFYLLIIIPNKKIRIALISIGLLLTLGNSIFGELDKQSIYMSFYFSDLNFHFVFGVIAAWVAERYSQYLKSKLFIIISLIVYIIVSLISNLKFQEDSIGMNFAFGISAFMIITSLACYEVFSTNKNGKSPFKMNKTGLFLADVTYCLYLIHIPIYLIVFNLNKYLKMPLWLFSIVMLTTAVTAAIIYYKLIEYPLMMKLKKIFGKKRTPTLVSERQTDNT